MFTNFHSKQNGTPSGMVLEQLQNCMKLRSGKLYSKPRNIVNMSETNTDEVPRGTLSTTETVISQVATLPPMTSAALTMSTTGAVGTSIPQPPSGGSGSTITTFRPYVPRFGTTYPLYRMPYSLIPGYQSTSSVVFRYKYSLARISARG